MVTKPSSMKLPTFTIDTTMVQSGYHGQGSLSDRTPFNESDQLSQPAGNKMSTLTLPSSPLRRPSTADVVIQTLRVERLDGGGLSVSGVALAANCHLTLIIFGAFFLLAGLVLSYIGYADQSHEVIIPQAAGAPHGTFKKGGTHRQMQVVGPVFLIVGGLMQIMGFTIYAIGRKIRIDEKDNRATVSAMQIRQLESSFSQARNLENCSPIHTFSSHINDAQPILSVRRASWWMEPAPVELPAALKNQMDQPPPYQRASSSSSQSRDYVMDVSPPQYQNCTQTCAQPAVTVHISYPLQAEAISAFPDAVGVASFPVKFDQSLDLAGRRHSTTSCNSSPSSSPTNVFEVQACPVNEGDSRAILFDESLSLKGDGNKTSEFDEMVEFQLPQIQVINSQLENVASGTANLSHVENNLPLSKNGVALPRLSRHSISAHGDIST